MVVALVLAGLCASTAAQDAGRGRRLYEATAEVTGRPVASCSSCHADFGTLRELIVNRGQPPADGPALARWLGAVIAGAHPGARNAKAQYRGVLGPQDLADLAAYIAGTFTAWQPEVQPQGGWPGRGEVVRRDRPAAPQGS